MIAKVPALGNIGPRPEDFNCSDGHAYCVEWYWAHMSSIVSIWGNPILAKRERNRLDAVPGKSGFYSVTRFELNKPDGEDDNWNKENEDLDE